MDSRFDIDAFQLHSSEYGDADVTEGCIRVLLAAGGQRKRLRWLRRILLDDAGMRARFGRTDRRAARALSRTWPDLAEGARAVLSETARRLRVAEELLEDPPTRDAYDLAGIYRSRIADEGATR